ncbi:MAG TPA: hypothetical protein VMH03_19290, partial [Terriglobales bacterium]|nr:hypothetical protein [Terriglobales bacterium]
GILLHINRMVFEGTSEDTGVVPAMPWSCSLTLALAAIPVIVLGLYVPGPVYTLLSRAATLIGG